MPCAAQKEQKMAKGKATVKSNGGNKEFHGRGPGPKGAGSPTAAGKHVKGDSRSKQMLKGISPQKGL